MGSCRLFIKAHKTHKEVTQSNSSDICPFWWRLEASFAYEWTHLPVNVIMVQSKLYLVIISGFSHYQIKSEMNLTWPCLPQYSQRPWHCWTMFFSSELIPRGPPPPHPPPQPTTCLQLATEHRSGVICSWIQDASAEFGAATVGG